MKSKTPTAGALVFLALLLITNYACEGSRTEGIQQDIQHGFKLEIIATEVDYNFNRSSIIVPIGITPILSDETIIGLGRQCYIFELLTADGELINDTSAFCGDWEKDPHFREGNTKVDWIYVSLKGKIGQELETLFKDTRYRILISRTQGGERLTDIQDSFERELNKMLKIRVYEVRK